MLLLKMKHEKKLLTIISCAVLFYSCTFSKISEVPSSQLQPVFFYGALIGKGSIYETGTPFTKLFDVNHSFISSSVSPLSTGILAFCSVNNMTSRYGILYYITNKGTIISRTYMDDTYMEIHNDFALSQSDSYASADGFAFTLYKVKNDSLGSFASNPLEKSGQEILTVSAHLYFSWAMNTIRCILQEVRMIMRLTPCTATQKKAVPLLPFLLLLTAQN